MNKIDGAPTMWNSIFCWIFLKSIGPPAENCMTGYCHQLGERFILYDDEMVRRK
jgi:hypothetical protein